MDDSPENVIELLRSQAAPPELKSALARGVLPLDPDLLLESLIVLSSDPEETIQSEAVKSLKRLPRTIVSGVCSAPGTSPGLLDKLARLFSKSADLMESVLLNPAATDETVAFIATLPHAALLEIIGRNQARIDRKPEILENLKSNEATPADVLRLWQEKEERRRERARRKEAATAVLEEEVPVEVPRILVEEVEEPPPGAAGTAQRKAYEEKKVSIIQMLKDMTAGHKVALAIKGNSDVRKILIRDKNRLVCTKVLENPRLTEREVEGYARSTNVSEDVLRTLAKSREWIRQTCVVRALVNNPKTPLGLSMGFLRRLSLRELEGLTKNRNVPEALRNTARKLHKQKKQARK